MGADCTPPDDGEIAAEAGSPAVFGVRVDWDAA